MIPSDLYNVTLKKFIDVKKLRMEFFSIYPFSLVFDGIQQILVMYK